MKKVATVAFKNGRIYFISFLLLTGSFLLFNKAYRELLHYTELKNRAGIVNSCFHNISRQINNAAVISPDFINKVGTSRVDKLFYTDSQFVFQQLDLLKHTVHDSINTKIALRLDKNIRSELSWITKSNVPDSILEHKSASHITILESIDSLINEGIKRTNILLVYRDEQVNKSINHMRLWMTLFIASAGILLIYTILKLFTQQSKSENRFRTLIENSDDIIAMLDKNMFPFYRSPSASRITGFTSKNMLESIQMDDIHPDDRESITHWLSAAKANQGRPVPVTYRLRHKEGHYIWLEGTFSDMLHNPDVKAIVANMRDITKWKRNEQHLKLLESVITNTNDAILITEAEPFDEPGPRIIYVNEAFTKMTGYSPEEIIGKTPRILQGPKSDKKELERLGKALRNWQSCEISLINYKKNGEEFWINFTVNPVADENGWFTHWISIDRNITIRKNEELQKMLLAEINQLFNKPVELKDTLYGVLELIVRFGDFDMTEAWVVSKDQKEIKRVAVFPDTETTELNDHQSTDVNKQLRGEGLPGKTWESKQIERWQNRPEDKNFIPEERTKQSALQTTYGLPIMYNNEVIGVFLLAVARHEHMWNRYTTLFENLGNFTGAEIKRKQLEQELNQIFSFAPDIICISGTDGYFKKINPSACELLGYTEEELLSVPFIEFIHPEDRHKSNVMVKNLNKKTPTFYFENRLITKSGEIIWLAWTTTPSPDEDLLFAVGKDITDKKELETLLNKANSLARLGVWEVDFIKESVYWSAITREIHEVNMDFEPTLANSINFYKEGENRELINHKVQQAMESGIAWDTEFQIVTTSGKEKWIRTIGDAEIENGRCIRMSGSIQDIDERKKAEIELQKSVKDLQDYMFALDESSIIAITDKRGVIQTVNDNFCRISRYSRQELVGNTHQLINSGYHPKKFFIDLWTTIASGKTWRGEVKNKTKDEEYYWVYTTITPFLDHNNKPFQYLAIRFDITEKKLAEEALLNSLNDKKVILESIGDGFFAVDKNWIVTYWNSQAEKMLNTLKSQIEGYNLWDVFSTSSDSNSYKKYHEAIETNQVISFEDHYPTLNKWYEISAYPSGNGLSVYFKDITERRISEIRLNELNQNLQKQARELAVSNAELEQFAYVASHDLQEPLRMVTSFLTQLEKKYGDMLDEKGKKYIDFAVDGAKRMRQIILDLLEFSRVGRAEDNPEEIDMNELVNDIRALYRQNIEEKNAIIQSSNLPVIYSYKVPLRQVFLNLIGNALKYSKKGIPVQIRIDVKETDKEWQFSITDNGIGISAQYFDKIFIIFQRLHNKDEFSGTGMGLAVSKKIIENLRGKIWLESEEGVGSTFHFTIKK